MKKYFSGPKGAFLCRKNGMVGVVFLYPIRSVGFHSCLASDFPRADVGFSALRAKIFENDPICTRNSAIFGYILSVFQAKFSFLGSSLNAVEVFNAKRAA